MPYLIKYPAANPTPTETKITINHNHHFDFFVTGCVGCTATGVGVDAVTGFCTGFASTTDF